MKLVSCIARHKVRSVSCKTSAVQGLVQSGAQSSSLEKSGIAHNAIDSMRDHLLTCNASHGLKKISQSQTSDQCIALSIKVHSVTHQSMTDIIAWSGPTPLRQMCYIYCIQVWQKPMCVCKMYILLVKSGKSGKPLTLVKETKS